MMEESVIRDIKNFTDTGYKSELLKMFIKMTPIDSDMGRSELEDYLLVRNQNYQNISNGKLDAGLNRESSDAWLAAPT